MGVFGKLVGSTQDRMLGEGFSFYALFTGGLNEEQHAHALAVAAQGQSPAEREQLYARAKENILAEQAFSRALRASLRISIRRSLISFRATPRKMFNSCLSASFRTSRPSRLRPAE